MSVKCQKRKRPTLFDHFVGAHENCYRDVNSEEFRRLEIDYQIEFGGLHHGKFRRLFSFKDTSDVDACLPPCVRQVRTVAHKTASNGVHATVADCGNPVAVSHGDVQAST